MTDPVRKALVEQLQNLQKMRFLIDAFGFRDTIICEDIYVPLAPEALQHHPVYAVYRALVTTLSPRFTTHLIPQGENGTHVRTCLATPKGRERNMATTPYEQALNASIRAARQLLAAQLRHSRSTRNA